MLSSALHGAVELHFYSSEFFKSISIGTNLKILVAQNFSTIIGKKKKKVGYMEEVVTMEPLNCLF